MRRLGMAAALCWVLGGLAATRGGEVLTWEDCVQLARESNPSLAASAAGVEAASAGVRSAKSSQFPQLSAGASSDYSGRSGGTGTDSGGDWSMSVSAGVEQSLYSGGANGAKEDSAKATLSKTRAAASGEAARVTEALRTAFVEVLYAQRQVELLRAIAARRADNLELVDLRYEGGREHKGSLALSRATWRAAAVEVGQAERRGTVAWEVLSRIIGKAPADGVRAEGSLEAVPAPEEVDWEGLAENTPEYEQAAAACTAAEAALRSARSGYLPDVSLSGSVGRSGNEESFDEDRWSAGVKVSFPFWPGGRTGADAAQAEAQLKQAEADRAEALNTLVRNLAETLKGYRNALENVEVARQYVEAAALRAEISRQHYEDGLLSFDNWDVIENDLISRRKGLLDSERTASLAEAAWNRVVGKSAF